MGILSPAQHLLSPQAQGLALGTGFWGVLWGVREPGGFSACIHPRWGDGKWVREGRLGKWGWKTSSLNSSRWKSPAPDSPWGRVLTAPHPQQPWGISGTFQPLFCVYQTHPPSTGCDRGSVPPKTAGHGTSGQPHPRLAVTPPQRQSSAGTRDVPAHTLQPWQPRGETRELQEFPGAGIRRRANAGDREIQVLETTRHQQGWHFHDQPGVLCPDWG